jgi:hypothetical protein
VRSASRSTHRRERFDREEAKCDQQRRDAEFGQQHHQRDGRDEQHAAEDGEPREPASAWLGRARGEQTLG